MSKISKAVNIPVVSNTATDRMEKRILGFDKKYGQITKNLNGWMVSGFMLGELGGAVMQTWIALDETGDLDGMNSSEKAQVLIDLLSRVVNKTQPGRPDPVLLVDESPVIVEKKTLDQVGTDYGA